MWTYTPSHCERMRANETSITYTHTHKQQQKIMETPISFGRKSSIRKLAHCSHIIWIFICDSLVLARLFTLIQTRICSLFLSSAKKFSIDFYRPKEGKWRWRWWKKIACTRISIAIYETLKLKLVYNRMSEAHAFWRPASRSWKRERKNYSRRKRRNIVKVKDEGEKTHSIHTKITPPKMKRRVANKNNIYCMSNTFRNSLGSL